MTITTETKTEIVKKIFSWGVGGVMLITGTLLVVFHKQLGIPYPEWLYGGIIIIIVGCTIFITSSVLQYLEKVREREIKLALISATKDDDEFNKLLEKFEKVFQKTKTSV